jgi:hypothetical protein
MVSLGLIYGFFRVHSGFHVGVSCQEFLSGFLLGFFRFHLGSLGLHLGYKQEKMKQKKRKKQRGSKDRKQRSKKTGSRAAKTHD